MDREVGSESKSKTAQGGDSNSLVDFVTYGCKVNAYDTGILENRVLSHFHNEDLKAKLSKSGKSKIVILNTCAVTSEATSEAIRQSQALKRADPNQLVVVTGCSAQVDTERFLDLGEVDLIVANSHKGNLEKHILDHLDSEGLHGRVFKSNIFKKEDLEEGGGEQSTHTRSFLKVQDGCNSFCTFCVIPFARGKSRSIPVDRVIERIKKLLDQDVKEVVITGIHLGDYEGGLENLVEKVLLKTRIPRLRLTSLEPQEVTPKLLELFSDPRLCPHVHMSIQSASTPVLAAMKRQYTAKEVSESLLRLHKFVPGVFIGMDVIAGFPTESEDLFLETYQNLKELPWSRIHVFPYSERPGTFAVKLSPKNEQSIVKARARRLRELSFERYNEIAKAQIGQTKRCLILKNNTALSRDYWSVELAKDSIEKGFVPNTEVSLKISGIGSMSRGGEWRLVTG
jgi:threonylcarbamoyladenosine tRNA methylthiotransferase MtaB